MKNINYLVLIAFVLFFVSCDKNEDTPPAPEAGDIKLTFDIIAGASDLSFDDASRYTNEAGNEFSVSTFWMYVSNIEFLGAEGTKNFQPEQKYFLIEENSQTKKLEIDLQGVPAGNYEAIQFAIGVDSPTNTDISAVSGDLDPARAWNWNSGYKFLTLEGQYFPPGETVRGLVMHIGLNENYKVLKFETANILNVNANSTSVNFDVNILKMFSGEHIINFNETNTIKAQPLESSYVADNYAKGMIQIK